MDTIYYEPYKLDKNSKSYMPDFLGNFAYSMDKREVTHEDLINKEELYIDYDVLSLEDIMNLPNLKHLYLCKNRYSYKKHIYPGAYSDLSYRWSTMISELERSAYAIKLMKELTGLQVHLYGDHFKKVVKYLSYGRWRDKYVRLTDHLSSSDYIYVPENTFPYVNYCNTTGWTVTANYPCDDNGPFENMFDKSDKTFWKPRELSFGSPRKHDVCIDMKKPTNMAGIVFTQADTYSSKKYLVKSIEIYYSDDKETWNSVYDTHNDIRINCSPGEKTKIDFNKNITARYVKFKVMDVDIPKYNKYVFVGMFHPYGNR